MLIKNGNSDFFDADVCMLVFLINF